MITMHSWMFIGSFENLRYKLITKQMINMIHLGIKAFEEIGNDVVQTCAFVICKKTVCNYSTVFSRLVDYKNFYEKSKAFLIRKYTYCKL